MNLKSSINLTPFYLGAKLQIETQACKLKPSLFTNSFSN